MWNKSGRNSDIGRMDKNDYFCEESGNSIIQHMKTFFVVASGIADLPDQELDGKTPLMIARTPALDALARCGRCGSILPLSDDKPLSRGNALLSILGYDPDKVMPGKEELERFGSSYGQEHSPGYFVLPGFSGHGVVVSLHPYVRGIGKMALLRPLEVARTTGDDESVLGAIANTAIEAIGNNEFVLVHVECAAAMSRKGDVKGKVEAIERIDREIISPIADYVWGAKEQMNMVVVSDCIASWRLRENVRGEVPAVVYFNDDLPYETSSFDENNVKDGPLNTPLPGDLIKKLVSFEPVPAE